jgi:hypothetical protein
VHHAHAAPAAAASRLDDDRVADGARMRRSAFGSSGRAPSLPGTQGTPDLIMACLADTLSPMMRMDSGVGPMKEAAFFHPLGEVGVLAQEAVAGVDGLGIGHLGRRNDGRHVEVAQRRRGRADAHRLVGQLDVLGVAVGLGIDHHRLDAHLAAGALDAQGDLAAVGDQDFLEHGCALACAPSISTNSGWPYSTAWPFSPRIWVMVPVLSASISFRIFMASMMQMVSPSLTALAHVDKRLGAGAGDRRRSGRRCPPSAT